LVFVVEGLALCHHMGTRALDPSSVLDYSPECHTLATHMLGQLTMHIINK
jgi:hypothetical protein